MELPINEDEMTDAQLKRWLIKEGGYDAAAADYIISVERHGASAGPDGEVLD